MSSGIQIPPKMNFTPPNLVADVAAFFSLAQAHLHTLPHEIPSKEVIELAIKLIKEETLEELIPNLEKLRDGAYSLELMANVLDDCVDAVYVIIWTCVALSLPFNPAWCEVQKKNMEKFPIHKDCGGAGCNWQDAGQLNGTGPFVTQTCVFGRIVIRNTVGKVVKPEGWTPPDIWGVLYTTWNAYITAKDKTP